MTVFYGSVFNHDVIVVATIIFFSTVFYQHSYDRFSGNHTTNYRFHWSNILYKYLVSLTVSVSHYNLTNDIPTGKSNWVREYLIQGHIMNV